jgi:uncharacterized protein with von Willebrand factor type A (vWA) domain
VSYAWTVNRRQVATGPRFRVPVSAFRKRLVCVATVSLGGGPADSAASKARTVARGKPLAATTAPTVSGRHRVGTRVKVRRGAWSPLASSYTYQWFRGRTRIRHATRRSLRLTASERGRRISCRVTAHRKGYRNGTALTRPVRVTK